MGTCHYSNDPPNSALIGEKWENLPDLRSGKLAKSMDECCMQVYPDYYDNVTKLQPQIQDSADFMWLNFDLALPQNNRRLLEETYNKMELRQLKQRYGLAPRDGLDWSFLSL